VSEDEAKRIFDHKLAICKVLGGDVKAQCAAAGVPNALIDKFLAADRQLTRFINRHDDSGTPMDSNPLGPQRP
jgi:hypothetical protein